MKLVEALTRLLPSASEEEGNEPALATVEHAAGGQSFERPRAASFDKLSPSSSLPSSPSSLELDLKMSSAGAGEKKHKGNGVDSKEGDNYAGETCPRAEGREEQSRQVDEDEGMRGHRGAANNAPAAHVASAEATAAAAAAVAGAPAPVEFWDKLR